jgi:hypothetical protein
MLSIGWAKKLPQRKVNACHPRDPCNILSRALGSNLHASAPTRTLIDDSGVIPFLCGLDSHGDVESKGSWNDGSQRPTDLLPIIQRQCLIFVKAFVLNSSPLIHYKEDLNVHNGGYVYGYRLETRSGRLRLIFRWK